MSTKVEYEAGKAERKLARDAMVAKEHGDASIMLMLDFVDRFVTAVERIADAMEKE